MVFRYELRNATDPMCISQSKFGALYFDLQRDCQGGTMKVRHAHICSYTNMIQQHNRLLWLSLPIAKIRVTSSDSLSIYQNEYQIYDKDLNDL